MGRKTSISTHFSRLWYSFGTRIAICGTPFFGLYPLCPFVGGFIGTPHRRHRRLRYPLHRLRKVPFPRYILNQCWWRVITATGSLLRQSAKGDNRKDKSGEKLAESEEDLLEHRTDGTDAFDTLYIGAEKFPFHDSFSINVSGVV